MNVASPVANVAAFLLEGKDGARLALLTTSRSYTYAELQDASQAVAAHLFSAGCQKGDRILLISENSFFWVVAYLGILRAGMVCVPLPATINTQDLAYILQITEARFAFLQTSFAHKNESQFRAIPIVTDGPRQAKASQTFAAITESGEREDNLPTVEEHDLAALMFTSGSTGKPRGVMVSHGNIIANTNSIVQYLELTHRDRIMTVLPFHYCFGTSLLHTHLLVGGSLVLDSRFMYPETVLRNLRDTECTGFAGVPSHYQVLLQKSSLKEMDLPKLRYVQQAGGHLPPVFVRELQQALPHARVYVMYGQTEATARLSYLPPERLSDKLGSVGKGIPGVTLQVLNDAGREVFPGEVGEIVARGANITRGYWRAPEDTAACFRAGQLHTGDLATVDAEGFVFIVDRAKDFLKCGGKRVSCRQVEEQLLQFTGLAEVAVIGIPDEILGEAVKAFVVARTPAPPSLREDIVLFCKEHFPHQLVPREIVFRDELPKNSAGKVLKQELRTA